MRKSKGKTQASENSTLPPGFEKIESSKFPQNHDFRDKPLLQGKVVEVKTVPARRGGKPQKILYVADKNGEISAVWENAMLASLFAKVRLNDEIFIRFEHTEGTSGRKKVSAFETGIKAK